MREENLFIQELISQFSRFNENYYCEIKFLQVYEEKVSINFRVRGNGSLGGLQLPENSQLTLKTKYCTQNQFLLNQDYQANAEGCDEAYFQGNLQFKCNSKNIEDNDELYFKYGDGYNDVLIWTFKENEEKQALEVQAEENEEKQAQEVKAEENEEKQAQEVKAEENEEKQAQEVKADTLSVKKVKILNIGPGGTVLNDYQLQFDEFNTFVGDVQLTNGQFYYEASILQCGSYPQMGWFTDGFFPATTKKQIAENGIGGCIYNFGVEIEQKGTGDDIYSFGVDGHRVQSWYNGSQDFGSEWKDGDVIGFAFDTKAKLFTVSVNGNYESPNGQVFNADQIKCEIPWIAPALTANTGEYLINFGDTPFKFAPPSNSYVSVHQANQEN